MDITELQHKVRDIFFKNLERDNLEVDDDYLVLKLTEELGEFVQSYLIYKKKCRPEKCLDPSKAKKNLSKEISDVIGLLFVIATELEIDLKDSIMKKWITQEWLKRKTF